MVGLVLGCKSVAGLLEAAVPWVALSLLLSSKTATGFTARATTASGPGPGAAVASAATAALASTRATPSSVYVNLPFCRRRCFYCDFPIKVIGDRPGAAAEQAKPYVEKVVQEIRSTAAFLLPQQSDTGGGGGGGGRDGVSTLFFGGGTPSLCPPELVGELIGTVRECFGIAGDAEISIEMDPGTFNEERLQEFLALGITRVSMGVQSFDAGLLKACGRAHSLGDVYEAVGLLRKAGVENFSIDIMSGLPNQTSMQWEHTLSEAISTGAAHVSVYDLQVEAGTAFGRWYAPGESPLPEDGTCADMYRTASRVLGGAGFEHYEISNYARPGFQSRHNRAYWENVPFLAFGNGAASYVDGRRFSRPRRLPEYETWVDELAAVGWAEATATAAEASSPRGGGGGDTEGLSDEALERDALFDDVMLGFRLKEGLDLDTLASKYGARAARNVEEGAAEGVGRGWVLRDHGDGGAADRVSASARKTSCEGEDGGGEEGLSPEALMKRGRIRLSDPDGFLFSNSVISSVFCELDGWQRDP